MGLAAHHFNPMDFSGLPRLIRVSVAARFLGFHRSSGYRWIWEGLVDAKRIGDGGDKRGSLRITKESFIKFASKDVEE